MNTGTNPGLLAHLLFELFRRIGSEARDVKVWVDVGYCIDAPNVLAAGSMRRDEYRAEGVDEWAECCSSMVLRE
jgi:hypothetical protein